MADYYPLIARAVAGLDKNSGDARRTIYERARTALVAQLRGVTPALNESDVTRERLALEEAIRKVEAESARQPASREAAGRIKAPEFPRWDEELEPERDPEPPRRPPAAPRPDARAAPAAPARKIAEPRHEESSYDPAISPDPDRGPDLDPAPQEPPRKAPTMPRAEPRQTGQAASARKIAEPRYPDSRLDPPIPPDAMPKDLSRAAARMRPSADRPPVDRQSSERQAGERQSNERQSNERQGSDRQPGDRSPLNSGLRGFREVVSEANELGGASAKASRSARDSLAAVPARAPEAKRPPPRPPDTPDDYLSLDGMAEPEMLEPSFGVDDSRPVPPRQRQAEPSDIPTEVRPRRSLMDLIKIAVALLIVAGFAVLLIWQWPNMAALYRVLSTPATEQAQDAAPPPAAPGRPKISDRFAPGGGAQPQPADARAVAPRVVLYEEDPNDPQGKRSVGSAVWRTDTISPGAGKPPELAIRADVTIPERGMSMTWTLRRDTDASRSTSHTIEIMFKLPADFSSGGIFNVPGIWMKEAEQTQGTALAGLAVKVTTNYFLIGLSAAPSDRDRNVQLLKDRPWFDIPIVYTNNRRAILAMEKGTPGDRVFQQAFAAWEK